jgi:hypothetical protein
MGITYIAQYFHPVRSISIVIPVLDDVIFHRTSKGRPAGAGVEFYRGVEKFSAAANAAVYAWSKSFTILPSKGSLGATQPGYPVLLWCKEPFPFFFSFLHSSWRSRVIFDQLQDIVPVHIISFYIM